MLFSISHSLFASEDATFSRSFYGAVNNDGVSSSGVAWFDMDGDRDLDLIIAVPLNKNNLLYENLGQGNFRQVTQGDIVNDAGFSSGIAVADYDNDGLPDIFIANQGDQDNMLYRNLGKGRFQRILEGALVSDGGDSYAACWGDYDNDGHLDLYVANSYGQRNFLYRNLGNGRFEAVTQGAHVEDQGFSYSPSWVDIDEDGDLDLFVVDFNPNRANDLYRNNGDGTFTKWEDHALCRDKAMSNGAAWADFDNDGDLDVFISNGGYAASQEQVNFFFINEGEGRFRKESFGEIATTADSALTAQWADVDNDGDLDLFYAVFRQNDRLFLNEQGRLIPVIRGEMVTHAGYSDGCAFADVDGDGDLDLALTHWENQNNGLYINQIEGNGFLGVDIIAEDGNRDGIGSRIRLIQTSYGKTTEQFRVVQSTSGGRGQNAKTAHFGLGSKEDDVSLQITWFNGNTTEYKDLKANHYYLIHERKGLLEKRPAHAQSSANPLAELYRAYIKNAAEGVRTTLDKLLKDGGDQDQVKPAVSLALMGYLNPRFEKPEDAEALFHIFEKAYPKSAEIPFAAAEFLRLHGKKEQASLFYERAAEKLAKDPYINPEDKTWLQKQAARYTP